MELKKDKKIKDLDNQSQNSSNKKGGSHEFEKVYKEKKDNVQKNLNNDVVINILPDSPKEWCLDKNDDGVEARVKFLSDYLKEPEAKSLYESLVNELNWQTRKGVNKFGIEYDEPRQTYWYGKPYKYSSVAWEENGEWNPHLDKLRLRLSKEFDMKLNSVMCNYYRDGSDSIGWHADDETSLGRCPKIASISLGETRVFEVCRQDEFYARQGKPIKDRTTFAGCTKMYRFHLNNGSLLIMEGSVQDSWLHRVPKGDSKMRGRINLTFRNIVDSDEEQDEIVRKKRLAQARRKLANNNNNKMPSSPYGNPQNIISHRSNSDKANENVPKEAYQQIANEKESKKDKKHSKAKKKDKGKLRSEKKYESNDEEKVVREENKRGKDIRNRKRTHSNT